jgi:hypothetical protein
MLVAAADAGMLAMLSGVHVAWAFRSAPPSQAVIPHVDGRPLFVPSRLATLGVAALLALAAASVLLAGSELAGPIQTLARIGTSGVALAFAGRVVGDFRFVGLFKKTRGTRFARADDRYFIPICLALAVSSAWVAAH